MSLFTYLFDVICMQTLGGLSALCLCMKVMVAFSFPHTTHSHLVTILQHISWKKSFFVKMESDNSCDVLHWNSGILWGMPRKGYTHKHICSELISVYSEPQTINQRNFCKICICRSSTPRRTYHWLTTWAKMIEFFRHKLKTYDELKA